MKDTTLSAGKRVGLVLAAVALVLLVAACAWWFMLRPMNYGTTFGAVNDLGEAGKQLAHVACNNGNKLDKPAADGGCNPETGDTSCRAALPMLCILPAPENAPVVAEGELKGWANTKVGATQAVSGNQLVSEAASDKLCQAELGPGWSALRTSRTHATGLRSFRSKGLEAPDPAGARYWVVNDREPPAGNCWNTAR